MDTNIPLGPHAPTGNTHHKFRGHGGREIAVDEQHAATVVWMDIEPKDVNYAHGGRGLQLVSEDFGRPLNYVGLRDGHTELTKLAISADSDGEILIQFVMPGPGRESDRSKTFTVEHLERMLAAMPPDPLPQ